MRPETLTMLVQTDPHSPAKFRVQGPFSNLPEFMAAFDVPEGAPMRRAGRAAGDDLVGSVHLDIPSREARRVESWITTSLRFS